jgi:GrpB-like predicted nucleotidyltransferase (UPF0157 family)
VLIEVVPYDSSWPVTFRSICSQLEGALAGADVISIEHIGSTSVPGLAAKPVIDVAIVVDSDAVRPAVKSLEGAGYEFRGDLGIPDRYAFRAPEGAPRQNVYVTIDGCLSLRNQLGLRSVLRRDGDLRDRYGALKISLSEQDHESIDHYIAKKSAFIQVILERAGLDDDELAAIDELNQVAD